MSTRFQMVGSDNPYTIAEVFHEHDVNSFRNDPGWYELPPVVESEVKTVKATKQVKSSKE
jgi:hypothetical protein